jgi:hypothetical protein
MNVAKMLYEKRENAYNIIADFVDALWVGGEGNTMVRFAFERESGGGGWGGGGGGGTPSGKN